MLQFITERKNGVKKRMAIKEALKAGSVAPYQVINDLLSNKCIRAGKKKDKTWLCSAYCMGCKDHPCTAEKKEDKLNG